MPVALCVFDAYGTLFDVAAAARAAAEEPGGERLATAWPRLADTWRTKQLTYTWLRSLAGDHADLWTITRDALDYALEDQGMADDLALRGRLMALYRELPAFPEAPEMLAALKAGGMRSVILSNGSPGMLESAIAAAGIADLLDSAISVEEVGVFKPHPKVYGLVERRTGVPPAQALFVSANGWDAACATGFGFTTLWVNRAGAPLDRLPWRPTHVAPDLTAAPRIALA